MKFLSLCFSRSIWQLLKVWKQSALTIHGPKVENELNNTTLNFGNISLDSILQVNWDSKARLVSLIMNHGNRLVKTLSLDTFNIVLTNAISTWDTAFDWIDFLFTNGPLTITRRLTLWRTPGVH